MPALYHAGWPGLSHPVARFLQLGSAGFFHQSGEAELVVEEVQSSLRDVLAFGDGDQAGEVAFDPTLPHPLVGFGSDQDVSVGQQELRIPEELPCVTGSAARTVLNLWRA